MIKKILNIFKRKSNTNSIISGCNGRLIINGEVIADNINPHGKISIIDNKIMLDGKEINTQGTELKHSFRPTVNITIEGNAGYIECNGNVTVKGDVDGNIDCGGSVTVSGNVHNKVDSGGSVIIEGDMNGNIDCGGSVTVIGSHPGKVGAGGSVYQAGR